MNPHHCHRGGVSCPGHDQLKTLSPDGVRAARLVRRKSKLLHIPCLTEKDSLAWLRKEIECLQDHTECNFECLAEKDSRLD